MPLVCNTSRLSVLDQYTWTGQNIVNHCRWISLSQLYEDDCQFKICFLACLWCFVHCHGCSFHLARLGRSTKEMIFWIDVHLFFGVIMLVFSKRSLQRYVVVILILRYYTLAKRTRYVKFFLSASFIINEFCLWKTIASA